MTLSSNKCTYVISHKTLRIAPTCFDPQIILRQLRFFLAKVTLKHSQFNSFLETGRNLRERNHWGDPDVDGRTILKWIFRKWEGVETGWSWVRIGTDGGHL